MIHLPRSHEGVSGRTDGQGPGVSRARNYLNQTGLKEVNFQWSFNKLKFSHVCVWLSWPVKVWTLCNSTVGSRTALRRSDVGPVISFPKLSSPSIRRTEPHWVLMKADNVLFAQVA